MDSLRNDRKDFLSTLQQDELSRLKKLTAPEIAERYLLVRGALRKLLGHYLSTDPKNISFIYNEHGKPFLNTSGIFPNIFFNLSHSKEMIVYAFSLIGNTGIDIEYIDPMRRIAALARYICSPQELLDYSSLTSHYNKTQAFFLLWTRKEAYVKADGRGLGMGLRSIHIGFSHAPSLSVIYKGEHNPRWWVKDVAANLNGYKLAVAVELPSIK